MVSVHFSVAGSTGTFGVADVALTGHGVSFDATPGQDTGPVLVGTFTDANPSATVADYSAGINWGDGSTPAAALVQADPHGGFDVTGDHTYTAPGLYTLHATVTVTALAGDVRTRPKKGTPLFFGLFFVLRYLECG